jgi:hypothetical protein
MRVRDRLREIDPRDAFDPGEVPSCEVGPAGVHRRDLAHLDHADRGLEIGQVVLVPRLPDVVVRSAPLPVPLPRVPLDPVEPEPPKARGEGVVVAGDHPPLGRRDVLDRVEGEDRDVSRSARTRRAAGGDALVRCAHGVRGILDHGDPGAFGRRADRVEVGGSAGEMNGDHRLRAGGDPCRERVGPHLEGPVVDVGENGRRPAQDDLVDGGGERHRGGCHLVPRADPQGREDDVETGGGGSDRDGVRRAGCFAEDPFQLGDFRSARDPAGTQRLRDRRHLLLAQGGTGQRQEIVTDLQGRVRSSLRGGREVALASRVRAGSR